VRPLLGLPFGLWYCHWRWSSSVWWLCRTIL